METQLLSTFAQIAGIGGIALGIFLLVFRDVIRKKIFPQLTKQQAYRLLVLALVLTWSVAIGGIIAWLMVSDGPDPGAEALQVFRARVRRVLRRVISRIGPGEHVVVTHGGVIAAVLADALDADYDGQLRGQSLDNAGVTALEVDSDPPVVRWVNSVGHLAPDWRGPGDADWT